MQKHTTQLNLRIPKELIVDIEDISKKLNVNKSEWIKIKLGELVYSEKNRLFSDTANKRRK